MAWAAPPTFTSGAALTAAQLNVLSGDLNETAAAKATAGGQLFVSTAANVLAARTPTSVQIDTAETTSSVTTYVNLATVGPSIINLTTGTQAIVMIGTMGQNSVAGGAAQMSYEYVTNSVVNAAPNGGIVRLGTDTLSSGSTATTGSRVNLQGSLTPGANTFHSKYTTPTGGTATFQNRNMVVIPL